jgi:hypothetical protein
MGNCNTCACTDKEEIQTYEVQVNGNRQNKENKNSNRETTRSSNNYSKVLFITSFLFIMPIFLKLFLIQRY